MDTILLHAPYVYLQKESTYNYKVYIIVALYEGETVEFPTRDARSNIPIGTISGTLMGEKISKKIIYKSYNVDLDYQEKEAFEPVNTEVIVKLKGLVEHQIIFYLKDADNRSFVNITNDFALNCPYLYLTRTQDRFTADDYIPKLLLPVKGYEVESEAIIETSGSIGILENVIRLKKASNQSEVLVLSDFKVNEESFKDDDEYVEGFYNVIVEAAQGTSGGEDKNNPQIEDLDAVAVSFSMPMDGGSSETKIRTNGANSISGDDLFIDDLV